MSNIIFLDLETTGLDPERDVILEIALIAYDLADREIVDKYSVVRPFTSPIYHAIRPVVVEMHAANGLWMECADRAKELDELGLDWEEIDMRIECSALDFYDEYMGAVASPMAGNTVSFDRAFLKKHMPTFESRFNHRHLDVSSLNIVADECATGLQRVQGVAAHRALPDCYSSIAQLEGYLEQLDRIGEDCTG